MLTFVESPTFTRQIVETGIIYLFYVYTKGRMADLDVQQKKRLRLAVERIKAEFGR